MSTLESLIDARINAFFTKRGICNESAKVVIVQKNVELKPFPYKITFGASGFSMKIIEHLGQFYQIVCNEMLKEAENHYNSDRILTVSDYPSLAGLTVHLTANEITYRLTISVNNYSSIINADGICGDSACQVVITFGKIDAISREYVETIALRSSMKSMLENPNRLKKLFSIMLIN
jgi:hypothetical protein